MFHARPAPLTRRLVLCGLAAAGLVALAGCATDREPLTRHEQVLANLTPELRTLYLRDIDTVNVMAHAENTNWRAFHGDLMRAFYVDRPSRLHPAPTPY